MLPLLLWDNAGKEEATPPPTHGAGRIPHRLISQSCLFLQKELLVESFWGLKMSPVKSQFHLCSVSLWTGNKSVRFAPLKGIYGPVGMLYESVTAWSKGDTLCGQREVQFLPSFPIFWEIWSCFWNLSLDWGKPRAVPMELSCGPFPRTSQSLPGELLPAAAAAPPTFTPSALILGQAKSKGL